MRKSHSAAQQPQFFARCSLCFGNVADSVSVAESLQVIKLSDSLAYMKASTAV